MLLDWVIAASTLPRREVSSGSNRGEIILRFPRQSLSSEDSCCSRPFCRFTLTLKLVMMNVNSNFLLSVTCEGSW